MKSTILLSLMVLAIGLSLNAQNLDKQKTKVTYTQLPLKPLPEEVTQYYVETDLGYIYSGDSKTETLNKIKSAAEIGHLEKTADQGAKLLVRLETYYKSEVNFQTIVRKEKRDDKEVSVTYHFLTFDYKYPLYFELTLPGEIEPFYSEFSNGSNQMTTYRSSEYRTSSELSNWWNSNYKSVQGKLRTDLLNKNVSDLRQTLDKFFSYRKNTLYTEFFTVKKFKAFEYDDIDQAWGIAKLALEEISENDIVFSDAFNTKMEEAIVIWKKALAESDLESRKTRINKKVTEALFNNIFLAYAMMSDFEKAEQVKAMAEEKINKRAIDNYAESFLEGRKERFEINAGRIPNSL
ncbi:hypothetical protein [Fulvivirga kasyanovii]|uniref:Uncharacterized protein n=1 Tax=Fulvivirga kasyanovii TaxID=396812 RepID=A0ABW9RQC8_9BACT|nr:hypothetical protein [Fulvivirga kasyanovii]MTI26372.1 hypothetical protein [Fulvivirga kasyanovii]